MQKFAAINSPGIIIPSHGSASSSEMGILWYFYPAMHRTHNLIGIHAHVARLHLTFSHFSAADDDRPLVKTL